MREVLHKDILATAQIIHIATKFIYLHFSDSLKGACVSVVCVYVVCVLYCVVSVYMCVYV